MTTASRRRWVPVLVIGLHCSLLSGWALAAKPLERARPVHCQGNETRSIAHRVIEAEGVAIKASGNCTITITDSELLSHSSFAIDVEGNARVVVSGSRIEGESGALRISGNGTVQARQSVVLGDISTVGNGSFNDQGRNRLGRTAQATATPTAQPWANLEPAQKLRCEGNNTLTLTNKLIRSASNAVIAEGNCTLTLRNSWIEAADTAIVVSNNATVHLENVHVEGARAAVDASDNGTVGGTAVLVGRVKKTANGTVNVTHIAAPNARRSATSPEHAHHDRSDQGRVHVQTPGARIEVDGQGSNGGVRIETEGVRIRVPGK